jgi:hypothetical protein
METNILTRTRKTAPLAHVRHADLGWLGAADLAGRGDVCALLARPSTFQGGAVVVADMAAVTPVVIDHTYSTRPGSPSCSPPV